MIILKIEAPLELLFFYLHWKAFFYKRANTKPLSAFTFLFEPAIMSLCFTGQIDCTGQVDEEKVTPYLNRQVF